MQSWIDYLDELVREGQISNETREKVEDGKIQLCPVCLGFNALSAADASEVDNVRVVSHRQGLTEWRCSHCGATLSDVTTPLLN